MDNLPAAVKKDWEAVSRVWKEVRRVGVGQEIQKMDPEKLGINALNLRHAMWTLRQLGLVETRKGVGTFRGQANLQFVLPWLAFYAKEVLDTKIDIVREVRKAVEGEAVLEAAEKRTAPDLLKMHHAIELQESARRDLQAWIAADQGFHLALLEASHNEGLHLFGWIIIETFSSLKVSSEVCKDPMASDILDDHWQIHTAITNRDGDEAKRLIQKHIIDPHERRKRKRSRKNLQK